ncbi:CHAT domain-containing protein [Pseudosulfitobacter sp. DSM 107133]|uniref:CHAT domain-containing protein n=1 Tax=Pseudosulfitobacter sp. DSM 107133 TaxID=2883100 RepID=UPI0013B43FB9|nr:CHAT domain-containing protein [Pseudosulfitobacter sp. DSM 107133]UOA30168.1 hypothetical protein DSM107133_04931 [Pseudosulfitobacter sp. DSM 107133]
MIAHTITGRAGAILRALFICGACLWATGGLAQLTPAQTREQIRDDVFLTLQRATSSVAGAALQQAALRQQAGNAALAALLRERSDLSDRAEADQGALAHAVGTRGAAAEAEIDRARASLNDIRRQIAALDARIEDGFPAFRELTNPRPMSVAEVQKTLHPGEVMIVTLTSEFDSFVWAISPDAADWHAANFEQDALVAQISLLRRMLDVTTQNRSAAALEEDTSIGVSADGFDRAVAYGLYQKLLAPLAAVIDGADHLIVVPDGPLTALPFGLLVASAPVGDDADPQALRDTDWLIGRAAMTVLPNVSSLRALRRKVDKTDLGGPRRPFVGFGDPVFAYRDSDAPTGMVTDGAYVSRGVFEQLSGVAGLAPLPGTARELRRLAQLTGAAATDLFLGSAATETAVRGADLRDVDIVAFATHGLLAGELSGLAEPALVFTPPGAPGPQDDALLTATEAAGLRLSAQLIILSACNTASGDGTPGAEGLSGLARSFIYAGARSILVSHWPVDDYATSVLTTGMVAEMQAGVPRSAALRRSMLRLMRDDPQVKYAHPRYWAPFILVGDG